MYNYNDINIKATNNFLRKVFLYMVLGIAISLGTSLYLYVFNIELLYRIGGYFRLLAIAEVAMVFGLSFFINKISSGMARMLFLLYSLLNGVTLSTIGFYYDPVTIVYAFTMTLVIFVVTSIFGYTTQEDLSSYRRFFTIRLISLIIMGLINMFLGVGVLYWIETIVGVVLFSGLIAYDVNRIKSLAYNVADGDAELVEKIGIIGALNLYLDFINLFLYVLRIFGRKSR